MRDAMAKIQDKLKGQLDSKGRGYIENYEVGDQVLLNAKNLSTNELASALYRAVHVRS